MMNANLVVHRDGDYGGITKSTDDIRVLGAGKEFQAGDERGV